MLYTCTAVANADGYRNTNAQLRVAMQTHSAQEVFSLIYPIITNIPCWHLLRRMDLHKVGLWGIILIMDIAIIDVEAVFPVGLVLVTRT